ncbi:MAG: cyclic nucleotide-binding and patatin-like phospholipase domain-containing protein [bacterium]
MATDSSPQPDDVVALLAGTSLFGDFDAASLHKIMSVFEYHRVAGGETLMQQGEPADGMYIVLAGRLRVFVEDPNGDERMVGEAGRGESVGEMAVLIGGPRTATVRAVRDSEVVRLTAESFEGLVRLHPELLTRLTRALVLRLNNTTHDIHPRRTVSTIAVIPAGGSPAPIAEAARYLAAALRSIGETLHVTGATVELAAGAPDADNIPNVDENSALVRWMNEQESRYRFVVYEADATPNPWTQCCIRQADYVLAVGAAAGDPRLSLVETWMHDQQHGTHAVTDLVLVHAEGTTPSKTRAWLEHRPHRVHHHVHHENREDMERVARLVTGRGVALVLSGGGARGYAHIGVIRALEERGVPIDVIGGTSMGAIIAAQYAKGLSPSEMVELCRRTFVAWAPHRSPTLPVVSLINARKLNRVLHAIAEDTEIEDLWLRYFCVSSNLTRARVEVQSSGNLYEGIRASCSVPGLGPPVIRGGELIVDGGVLNNLPADIARTMTQGKVFASNVAAKEDVRSSIDAADDMSGWALLFNMLNPFSTTIRMPSFPAIIERTSMLAGVLASDAVSKQVDLYFEPPVQRFAATQWAPLDIMVKEGYAQALTTLDEWRARGGDAIRHTDAMPTYTAPSVPRLSSAAVV